MEIVFADTGYWIALLNPKDNLHQIAVKLSEDLYPVRIVTSELILDELLNNFSSNSQLKKVAANFVEQIENNNNINVIIQTPEDRQEALELYKKYTDKQWGITDCISFNIMKATNINKALAYDIHFIQAGYRALMREYKEKYKN